MTSVILSEEAEKDYNRLPRPQQGKIIRKLKILGENPLSGKLLGRELKGFRVSRAWPYRILYEFFKSRIVVHRILHRQGAYK